MLGQFVALIGRLTLGEYAYFTLMYGDSSMQKFERFALLAILAAVFGLFAFIFVEKAVEGAGAVVGILSAIILLFVFKSAFSTYRKKFVSCPKCGQETKIAKDDLLSENVISERTKGSDKKIKVNHYRVGTRLVTIACQSCDYTKAYELKFKERT